MDEAIFANQVAQFRQRGSFDMKNGMPSKGPVMKAASMDDMLMDASSGSSRGLAEGGGRKGSSQAAKKFRPAAFSAELMRIGSWCVRSQFLGDLLVRFYYSKRQIVLSQLEGGISFRMEIGFDDISGMEIVPDNAQVSSLYIEYVRPPRFLIEVDPQPKLASVWNDCQDFTQGNASSTKRVIVTCVTEQLSKHVEKLQESDNRIRSLLAVGINIAASGENRVNPPNAPSRFVPNNPMGMNSLQSSAPPMVPSFSNPQGLDGLNMNGINSLSSLSSLLPQLTPQLAQQLLALSQSASNQPFQLLQELLRGQQGGGGGNPLANPMNNQMNNIMNNQMNSVSNVGQHLRSSSLSPPQPVTNTRGTPSPGTQFRHISPAPSPVTNMRPPVSLPHLQPNAHLQRSLGTVPQNMLSALNPSSHRSSSPRLPQNAVDAIERNNSPTLHIRRQMANFSIHTPPIASNSGTQSPSNNTPPLSPTNQGLLDAYGHGTMTGMQNSGVAFPDSSLLSSLEQYNSLLQQQRFPQ